MNIRSLIVDDELSSRNILKKMIIQFCPSLEIVGEADGVTSAIEEINTRSPQLVFLDIELSDGDAFYLLDVLPTIDFKVIFVTGYDHYALQAIKHNALDYILKPINVQELIAAVDSAKKQFVDLNYSKSIQALVQNISKTEPKKKIKVFSKNVQRIIEVANISHLESNGRISWIHLANGERIAGSYNIGFYEKELQPSKFYRIHNKFLVNTEYVSHINLKDLEVELRTKKQLPVSRGKLQDFRNYLLQHLLII